MALDDILIGVDVDADAVPSKLGAVTEVINFLSQQTQAAIADFNRFDQQALDLGVSMEELTGISSETAEAYREFNTISKDLDATFRGLRIQALAPVVKEINELGLSILNVKASLSDLKSEQEETRKAASDDLNARLYRLARQALVPGLGGIDALFDPQPLTRRVTEAELSAREKRRFGEELRLTNEMKAELREKEDEFTSRVLRKHGLDNTEGKSEKEIAEASKRMAKDMARLPGLLEEIRDKAEQEASDRGLMLLDDI